MYRMLLIMVSAIYLCYPLSGYAQEECGDSYYDIYNGDCDFKNEDTHLWGYQPGTYFAKEDRVEELIQQGESFIDNYYASVKTSGDLAFRFMIAPTAASMTIVETQQAIVTALLLANDGYDLKELYTDAICEAYWEALESITGIDRDCPTTSELLTDIQQLGRLDDVRTEILDIITNPNLVLGEQWNSVIGEINSVRSRLSSLETFGRNIATPDIETRFNGLYPSLANLIAAPNETRTQYYDRVEQNFESRRITLREHMLSTRQHHEIMTTSDKTELEVLDNMSSRAVGEMQADEIDNMLQMQGVQNVLMMSEEIMNINALFIQNHVDANDIETRRRAYEIKAGMPIPGHEVAVGNEAIFTR